MARGSNGSARRLALLAGSLLAAAALPSAVLAYDLLRDGGSHSDVRSFASFTPGSADPQIAELVAQRSGGKARMLRFTPAGASLAGAPRSVTVAVRIDQQVASAITGRGPAVADGSDAEGGLRLAQTRYNLGLARGYRSFSRTPAAPALSRTLSGADIPDLASFTPATRSTAADNSRFAARIALDEVRSPARAAESAGRTADQLLDVGGSYRLTRNLDVRAGVRYEQDRDLRALPDLDQQDSQAVYIGTQFRF